MMVVRRGPTKMGRGKEGRRETAGKGLGPRHQELRRHAQRGGRHGRERPTGLGCHKEGRETAGGGGGGCLAMQKKPDFQTEEVT